MKDAACLGSDPALFYPEPDPRFGPDGLELPHTEANIDTCEVNALPEIRKRFCNNCPALTECAEQADPRGIAAGMTSRQRRTIQTCSTQ